VRKHARPLLLIAPDSAPGGAEFTVAGQKAGQKWFHGSVGVGSVGHLGMEVLKTNVKGLAPVHVPFNGNPQVVTSLVGGEIQMALVPPGVAMPMVKAGTLRAIGLTGGRSALVPEVPQADAGVRDFNLEVWTALVGRRGSPRRRCSRARSALGRSESTTPANSPPKS
jgi:tripartite-type tricarboxylate transporter receptor subunit TctC